MSRNEYSSSQISIAVAITLMLLAALLASGCTVKGPLSDAEIVESVSEQIAGYTVPDGYREEFAVDMLGYQVVNLQGPEPSCHIYLVQSSDDDSIDLEGLQEQAAAAQVGGKTDRYSKVEIVEKRAATIRGQEVTLMVGEGLNSDNQPFRQVNAVFAGRNGPALVSISAPEDLWDWALVDSFLASME